MSEEMILCVLWHVSNSGVQYLYYKFLVLKVRLDCKNNTPHSDWSDTFVVDYRHNMEVVFFYDLQNQTSPHLLLHANEYVQSYVDSAHIHDG